MRSIPRQDVPVAIADGDVEVRVLDQDGMMVGFVRLPAGADLRPATKGLPDDLCPCPHWGYMLKGRVRMHTTDGHQDFAAGEAFCSSSVAAGGGSDSPLPRRSKRIRRENCARRSKNRAIRGSSHMWSTCDSHAETYNRSIGPSPTTW